MQNFKVSVDYEQFDHKPSAKLQYKNKKDKFGNPRTEISVIGSRLGTEIKELSVSKLAACIAKGQTWSPYTFKECPDWKRRRRLEGLFESCQVYALDFDNGEKLEELIDKTTSLGLTPNIVHESFSSTLDYPKFRFIFVGSEVITDFSQAKKYATALAIAFNSDKSCVDTARLYFGSTPESVKLVSSDPQVSTEFLEKLSKKTKAHLLNSTQKRDEHKDVEWGDAQLQRSIFSKLPRKKLNLVKSKIKTLLFVIENYSGDTGESRYNILWKHTSKIARMPEVTGLACYEWVMDALGKNPYYASWDYNASCVVTNAIEWSFMHADDPM
jgi:hypothetical protein